FLLQALYGAVDLFVVGLSGDAAAVSAVSIGAQTLHALIGVVVGFSVGGVVYIGYNVGANDNDGVSRAIGATSTFFGVATLTLTPLIVFGTDFLVDAMRTPPEAVDFARQYFFVCACGFPLIVGCNVVAAIYRGLGDSRTPVYFVAVACAVNIIADLILVLCFKLGPFGAAVATVGAQAVSFFYAVWLLKNGRFSFKLRFSDFFPKFGSISRIVKVGSPLALQDALVNVSFLIILAIVNEMGVAASAGLGVAERAIGFLMLPAASFGTAVATATAQNLGAAFPKRALSSFLYGTGFSLAFGLVFWTICQICPETVARIFADDAEIARQGALYLRSFALDYICVAFVFNFNGYFCGCGKTLVALAHGSLATLAARIPLSYLFSRPEDATLYEVGFAAPLASVVSIVVCVGYFAWLRRAARLERDAAFQQENLRSEKEKTPSETPLADAS
ncbi:MAG: MATE family efflux transporter, partial [Thermoguttaceae bacterium]|nr:MATE family efflux transporter [Thermoguttaceae bacterium]